MADYKDFMPRVAYEVIGCPIPIILKEIKQSVIRFCEESVSYTVDTSVTLIEGQREYTLTLDANLVPVRPVRVIREDGGILGPVVEDLFPGDWEVFEGKPTGYFMSMDKKIVFYEKPREDDAGDVISIKVAVKPSKTNTLTTIPDWIYEDYEEGIAAGAKYGLQMIRDKDWSSKKSASDNLMLFKKAVTTARRKALKSNTIQSRYVRPRVFGGMNG